MKITCSVEKLKNAVNQADRITGKNLTLPVLGSILCIASGKSFKLRSTNLSLGVEIEIPAIVEKDGVFAVSGEIFVGSINSISDTETILELNGDTLTISTKHSNVSLKTNPYEDFPTLPIVEGMSFTLPSKKISEGLKSVSFSSAISDIKPEISSVFIYPEDNNLIFVATDSFRLAEKKIPVKNISEFPGIIIPFKNTSEIIKTLSESSNDVLINLNKNQISFTLGNLYLTSRVIDGIYPDYKQIIPKESSTEAIILKEDIIQALKMAHVISDKFNQITLITKPKEKQLIISSKNNDVGEQITNITSAVKGEPVEISFNYRYLLDCFQSFNDDSVVLGLRESMKPMIIHGVSDRSFTYLIMPLNR